MTMINIKNIIWGLEEMSDKDLQEKLWTGRIDGEVSSFTEAISVTFDDSGLGYLLDTGISTGEISDEVIEKAKKLDSAIRAHPLIDESILM